MYFFGPGLRLDIPAHPRKILRSEQGRQRLPFQRPHLQPQHLSCILVLKQHLPLRVGNQDGIRQQVENCLQQPQRGLWVRMGFGVQYRHTGNLCQLSEVLDVLVWWCVTLIIRNPKDAQVEVFPFERSNHNSGHIWHFGRERKALVNFTLPQHQGARNARKI